MVYFNQPNQPTTKEEEEEVREAAENKSLAGLFLDIFKQDNDNSSSGQSPTQTTVISTARRLEMEDPSLLITALESRELEVEPNNVLTVEEYMELLAYYLVQDNLCEAKFLWKRIPNSHKEAPELVAIWEVGKKLWTKDLPGFYTSVNAFAWNPTIAPVMARLLESIREKVFKLIGSAYSSVRPEDVAILLGVEVSQVDEIIGNRGWTVSEGLIVPVEPLPEEVQLTPSEDQIGKLTEFVSVLEN